MKILCENNQSELEAFYEELDQRYQHGDLEQVENFLRSYEKELLDENEEDSMLVAVYNELGTLYRMMRRCGESALCFESAKDIIKEKLGTQCTEYASMVNNMAGTYRTAKRYREAIEMFEEAVEIYSSLGRTDFSIIANIHHNIASLYQEMKQYELAIDHLEEALMLYDEIPHHEQEMAIGYSNLNILYSRTGQSKEAMECAGIAVKIFESCEEEMNPHYAMALNNMAGYLCTAGDYEQAAKMYMHAIKYMKKFFGETLEYGQNYHCLYWVYRRLGQNKEALDALKKTEQVYTKTLGKKDERTMAVQEELKRIFQKVS